MADLPSSFEGKDLNGDTIHENGTVGTSAVFLPAVAGNIISEFVIECLESNGKTQTLLISLDGGTNFKTIFPGDTLGWTPKGNQTQIKIKGGAADTEYEAILNREPN